MGALKGAGKRDRTGPPKSNPEGGLRDLPASETRRTGMHFDKQLSSSSSSSSMGTNARTVLVARRQGSASLSPTYVYTQCLVNWDVSKCRPVAALGAAKHASRSFSCHKSPVRDPEISGDSVYRVRPCLTTSRTTTTKES